ncbi:MAG: hypothetical protein LBF65_02840 [Holosporales bacterium]|jgi:hypothetical protein|nr:hypothetical protein [Holosporales bacterium]
MSKQFLVLIFGVLEVSASGPFLLPEYVSVCPTASYNTDGTLLSVSANQKVTKKQKLVIPEILNLIENFHKTYITNEKPTLAALNDFVNNIDDRAEEIRCAHNVVIVDVISHLISAGMGLFTLSDDDRAHLTPVVNPDLLVFLDAGCQIAEYVNANPVFHLRFELHKEYLQAIATELSLDAFLERINDQLLGFEKCPVPLVFLEYVHRTAHPLLAKDQTLATILSDPTEAQNRVMGLIFEEGTLSLATNAFPHQQRNYGPDPYGYRRSAQVLPMNLSLVNKPLANIKTIGQSQLNKTTKQWCIAKAAIRYLYENPRCTIEDAVDASINVVQGSLNDLEHLDPLGDDIEESKQKASEILTSLRARELCQVGRWAEHIPSLKHLLTKSQKQNWNSFYFPDFKYLGPANPPLTNAEFLPSLRISKSRFPIVMRRYALMDNYGAGNCGLYAAGMQSRLDLVRWLQTHKDWFPFLPRYFKNGKARDFLSLQGHLNGIGTIIQEDGFLMRYGQEAQEFTEDAVLKSAKAAWEQSRAEFSSLPKDQQQLVKSTHPGAVPWNLAKVAEAYGYALPEAKDKGLDFGFISSLLSNPIVVWQLKSQPAVEKLTDFHSPANLTAWIFPDGFLPQSDRSRPRVIFARPGHYLAMVERDDILGTARNFRHQEAGTSL